MFQSLPHQLIIHDEKMSSIAVVLQDSQLALVSMFFKKKSKVTLLFLSNRTVFECSTKVRCVLLITFSKGMFPLTRERAFRMKIYQ